jgi:hypothetical protein
VNEVHAFSAAGTVGPSNERYTRGERHDLLVLVRQVTGTDHDWEAAERVVAEAGWVDIAFEKAATVSGEPSASADAALRDAVVHALSGGSSILVYGVKRH